MPELRAVCSWVVLSSGPDTTVVKKTFCLVLGSSSALAVWTISLRKLKLLKSRGFLFMGLLYSPPTCSHLPQRQ